MKPAEGQACHPCRRRALMTNMATPELQFLVIGTPDFDEGATWTLLSDGRAGSLQDPARAVRLGRGADRLADGTTAVPPASWAHGRLSKFTMTKPLAFRVIVCCRPRSGSFTV